MKIPGMPVTATRHGVGSADLVGLLSDLLRDPARVGEVLVHPVDRATGAGDDVRLQLAVVHGLQHACVMGVEATHSAERHAGHMCGHGAAVVLPSRNLGRCGRPAMS